MGAGSGTEEGAGWGAAVGAPTGIEVRIAALSATAAVYALCTSDDVKAAPSWILKYAIVALALLLA